jgi:hypothetical protein
MMAASSRVCGLIGTDETMRPHGGADIGSAILRRFDFRRARE